MYRTNEVQRVFDQSVLIIIAVETKLIIGKTHSTALYEIEVNHNKLQPLKNLYHLAFFILIVRIALTRSGKTGTNHL